MISESKGKQKDPYRSPHEVVDSESFAKKVGWGRLVLIACVLLVLAVSGLLAFKPTAKFNMQRRPYEVAAPQPVELGTPASEEEPTVPEGDLPQDPESTRDP